MYSRLATIVPIAALVAVATAAPGVVEARDTVSQCNTSDQYCCNSDITQTTSAVSGLLGILNGLNLGAGITCSPIGVIQVAGNSCTQQPVCCTGNTFNGLVNVACTPINVNL
ncbi:fungal hydrophobin [Boletus coccyginus]|nr:fungal hydrophobin [Boletus coccyginus]